MASLTDPTAPLGQVLEDLTREHRLATQRSQTLVEVSRLIAEFSDDLTELLRAVARRVSEITGDACCIRSRSADGEWLTPRGDWHADPLLRAALEKVAGESARRIELGLMEVAFSDRRVVRWSTADGIPLSATPTQRDFLSRWAIQSGMVAPLVKGAQLYGGIALFSIVPGRVYTLEDEEFIERVAQRIALAIHHAMRLEAVEKRLGEQVRLQAMLERLDMVIKSSNDAIVVTTIDGVVTYWNPAAERLYGYSADEAISQSLMELVGPDRADEVRRVMRQLLRGEPITSYETERRTRDGRQVIVWVSIVPIKDRDGSLVGVASFGRDVTEQRRLEQEATRAQRLEAAGEVAGQVAHDFNNLLVPIVGLPEIIRNLLPPDHPAAAYCDMITEAASAMAAINEDLLALGRRGQLQFSAVDLNAVVREAAGFLAAGPPPVEIELDLAEGLSTVNGVRAQLLRVVMNLLTNARDAIAGGGHIRVRTTETRNAVPVGDSGQAQRGVHVRLQIEDTGAGILPEIVERIFEPFFTTKNSGGRPGTGLGLSVVRAIVADHAGTIEMTSEVGVGTTFTILLPATASRARTG